MRSISRGGVSLIVTNAPSNDRIISRDFIAMHSELGEELMDKYALLPVRFGTILVSGEKGMELLEKQGSQFASQLKRVAGKVEMGLKAIWENRQKFAVKDDSKDKIHSGKRYLLARMEQVKEQKLFEDRARAIGNQINAEFAWAEDLRVKYLSTPKLFYNASFLISKNEETRFWERVEKLKIHFPGLKFLASGPWPPYNFSNINEQARGGN